MALQRGALTLLLAVLLAAKSEGANCKQNEVCINIRRCDELLSLLSRRNEPGVTQRLRDSLCGYEGSDPRVCCPRQEAQLQGRTAIPVPGEPAPGRCGYSNTTHVRIIGGKKAELGAWPWLTALIYRGSNGPRVLCGGALITDQHVLTAAHCVYNRSDLYKVRIGDLNLLAEDDGATPIESDILEKKMHEGYRKGRFENDIAILKLKDKIPFSFYLHPICLPLADDLRSNAFVRYNPFIAGWGAIEFRGPSSADLLETQLPVVEPETCEKAYERFNAAVIDDRVLCAGFAKGGKDACQGDSGGPLMLPQGRIFYTIGVVSYGHNCAEPGVPGVYTRVTKFLDWIKNNID
ncbi:venom protease-like [Schistocerca piceifrons]|uniref:venom protease-like n=1 Tax=Schistocerca piceifrons TaxID=274613 RepID=UPI001F5E5AB9|nr:venom protease-like [Schistocerca piceifrons]